MKLKEIGPRRGGGCTFLEPPGPVNVKQQIFLDCALYHISMHLSSSWSESIFQLRARWLLSVTRTLSLRMTPAATLVQIKCRSSETSNSGAEYFISLDKLQELNILSTNLSFFILESQFFIKVKYQKNFACVLRHTSQIISSARHPKLCYKQEFNQSSIFFKIHKVAIIRIFSFVKRTLN